MRTDFAMTSVIKEFHHPQIPSPNGILHKFHLEYTVNMTSMQLCTLKIKML